MNELQHIRSMAEMIIQKVDALDGTEKSAPKVADPVWHSGPPPHIGWWNATSNSSNSSRMYREMDFKNIWMWWDGKDWSLPIHKDSDAINRPLLMPVLTSWSPEYNERVVWTDYYPENARVPRINPGELE